MKPWAAALVTFGLLAVALWAGRRDPRPAAADTPDRCIQQMFAAASAGDVEGYLNCFGGDELTELRRKFARQSRESAAAALRAVVAGMKGHAIHGSPTANSDQGGVGVNLIELPVERVYAQHNELQTYRLRRDGERWQIVAIRASGNQQPTIPYGTPVF